MTGSILSQNVCYVMKFLRKGVLLFCREERRLESCYDSSCITPVNIILKITT